MVTFDIIFLISIDTITHHSLSIDNTDGATIYISQESLDAKIEFSTSKSSEMNLQWEKGEDIIEKPIPEQYKHTIEDGKVTVSVSDLYT